MDNKIRAKRAVTWLLVAGIFFAWLIPSAALTIVTAQEVYDRLYDESFGFPSLCDRNGRLTEFYDKSSSSYGYHKDHPDLLEYSMLEIISRGNHSVSGVGRYTYHAERSKLIRDIRYPMETAVLFYDGSGNLIHSSDDSFIFFNYYTQTEWDAGLDTSAGQHCGWIDISEGKDADDWHDDPYLRFRTQYAGTHDLHDFAFKIDAVIEGTELIPVRMYYITYAQKIGALEKTDEFDVPGGYEYLLSDLDRTGLLEWQLQFDRSELYGDKELTTVYAVYPQMWSGEKSPQKYNGSQYAALTELTAKLDFPSLSSNNGDGSGIYKLNDLLMFSVWRYADYEGFDYTSGGKPETDFYMVTAIRSNPLRCAFSALQNVYIISFFLAAVIFLTVRGIIKKRFLDPIAQLADGSENFRYLKNTWAEPEAIRQYCVSNQRALRDAESEILRQKTALEYADSAEKNRREMISAIAHELKTPLAVIHSYAEGLKENIADEKRDKYLDIILSESEKTDAMVLEMLDLSRLEAGKIKLSREDFSLVGLTRSVIEKLDLQAQAKALNISFTSPDDLTITADEARIAQVIENFASNAVRYTPDGGNIRITVGRTKAGAVFRIENDSAPLSQESLEKVWDTFYRADESRSGGGTGLGLAIAKNIIALHGGNCFVQNTSGGVEFGFEI